MTPNILRAMNLSLDLPKMPAITPASIQQADSFKEGVQAVIQAMQAQLKEDEELLVHYRDGTETIRVLHFFMSSTNVAVLSGVDAQNNRTTVVAHFNALQFVCKIRKVQDSEEKQTIGFSS